MYLLGHQRLYSITWLRIGIPTLTCMSSATSMDFPDSLSPPISIVHRFRDVFQATSCIDTELLYIGSSWSTCLCSSMRRGPQYCIAYEFVLTSPAVSHKPRSSHWDNFCDGWLVAVQLLICVVLLPGLVQYSAQHFCIIAVKLFLHAFC